MADAPADTYADEAEQQATFERLDSMGFTCKVLVN